MKLKIKAGTTSRIARIYIQDSSSATGAPLTGLTYLSAGLTWYWARVGDATATVVSLANPTLGAFTAGGFKEFDPTNMPGVYEIGIPNAAIQAGATAVHMVLKGATNMLPVPIEIELDVVDYQTSMYAQVYQATMTESYPAAGSAPTPEQATMMIMQQGGEFAYSGTTKTVKKLNHSTTAATFTLDSSTSPTSITRAT